MIYTEEVADEHHLFCSEDIYRACHHRQGLRLEGVWMVMEVGDLAVQAMGMDGRQDKVEEWLKALFSFLSSVIGKEFMVFLHSDNYEGIVVLLRMMLEKNEVREEEVGQSLRLFTVDV